MKSVEMSEFMTRRGLRTPQYQYASSSNRYNAL